MMKMVEISAKRYTTKHYDKTKKIPPEQFEELCTILQNTPSSVNSQPWHFLVVSSDDVRQKMLPAVRESNWRRITDPSHLIILCIRTDYGAEHLNNILEQEDKDGRYLTPEDKKLSRDARNYFVGLHGETTERLHLWERNQVYIALGNLLFAAAGMGIDSTAIEGFNKEKLDAILNLEERGLKSVCIASLGYRSADDSNAHRPKSRLPKALLFSQI